MKGKHYINYYKQSLPLFVKRFCSKVKQFEDQNVMILPCSIVGGAASITEVVHDFEAKTK